MVLLRRGRKHSSAGLEVLLGRRTSAARFMADVWVFPGGAVDGTGNDDVAHRETALRELQEEASVTLPSPDDLVPFSRWITPEEVKVRYDTHFYLALAPAHCVAGARRRGDRRGALVRALGGARAAPGGRAAARVPDDQEARDAGALQLPRRGAGDGGRGRSGSRSCPASTRAARSRACCSRATRTTSRLDRRQALEEEPVPQLGLAREAVGLRVAAGVHDDLAALEGSRDRVVEQDRARPRAPPPRARSAPAGSPRTGKAPSSRSIRSRSRETGLPAASARTRADHLGRGVRQHDRDVALVLPSAPNLYSRPMTATLPADVQQRLRALHHHRVHDGGRDTGQPITWPVTPYYKRRRRRDRPHDRARLPEEGR